MWIVCLGFWENSRCRPPLNDERDQMSDHEILQSLDPPELDFDLQITFLLPFDGCRLSG